MTNDAATRSVAEISDHDLEIREATVDDIDTMLAVLNSSFAFWPPCEAPLGQRRYTEWLFDHPDTGIPGRPTVAIVDGRIAYVSMGSSRPYLLRGEVTSGSRTGTGAVHPDFRGLRISSKAGDQKAELTDRAASYGWSLNPAVQHRRRRRGDLQLQNSLGIYLRVFDAVAEGRAQERTALLETPLYLPFHLAGALRSFRFGHSVRAHPWAIRKLERFDDRFESLSREAATEFDLIPLRGAEEYNWRYLDERGGRFELFAAEQGDELLGYFVIAMRQQRGHIVDLLTLPGRHDVVRSLIAAANDACRLRGASSVECWMMDRHQYTPLLKSAGFFKVRGRSRTMQGRFNIRRPKRHPDAAAILEGRHARIHVVQGDCNEI